MDIYRELSRIQRAFHLDSKRIEKDSGISLPQWLCLHLLQNSSSFSATPTDLKNALNVNASTISGIIGRLEQKSLIHKKQDLKDKRITRIELSVAGDRLLQSMKPSRVTLLRDKFDEESPQMQEQIQGVIQWIIETVHAENVDPISFDQ